MEQSIKYINGSSAARTSTIINEGSELAGEFSVTGSIYIAGHIRGSINARADIAIGKTGRFYGGIMEASSVIISGIVDSKVIADTIEILDTGYLKGDLFCDNLKIHKGGLALVTRHGKKDSK